MIPVPEHWTYESLFERFVNLYHRLVHGLNEREMLDSRNRLTIARGLLELTVYHGEPLDIDRIESLMRASALEVFNYAERREFLIKFATTVGWMKAITENKVEAEHEHSRVA